MSDNITPAEIQKAASELMRIVDTHGAFCKVIALDRKQEWAFMMDGSESPEDEALLMIASLDSSIASFGANSQGGSSRKVKELLEKVKEAVEIVFEALGLPTLEYEEVHENILPRADEVQH